MIRSRPVLLALLWCLAGCQKQRESAPVPTARVTFAPEKGDVTRVEIVATGAQGVITLRALADDPAGQVVLGRTVRRMDAGGEVLVFVPLAPLAHGTTYRARFKTANGETFVDYAVPADTSPRAVVEALYPEVEVVPSNILKFYVRFSRPMEGGDPMFERIKLHDETDAKDVTLPWRTLDLWSTDRRTLTLLPHPGRVKRLIPYAIGLGEVLHEGHAYALTVTAEVRDAGGRPMAASFTKRFRAGPPDRERPLPERWGVTAPAAGTLDPLVVDFAEPMEHALLLRSLTITSTAQGAVEGTITAGATDRSARFVPKAPWAAGAHAVSVDQDVEDLAGNTPRKLFDAAIGQTNAKAPEGLQRAFVVK